MANDQINPRKLRPAEAVRLLNATPLGEVVGPQLITRHLNRAAYKIGDGKRIDLVRYAAWLFHARERTTPPGWTGSLDGYEKHKERANARGKAQSESSRDIARPDSGGPADGWVHAPRDPERRRNAATSFRNFCDTYFPQTFNLPWSPDHLKVIAKIEEAVLNGGLFAMAMPRGSGKAVALDTPLATPSGWTTMGEVRVGDTLFDERGHPCSVTFVTEVMYDRPCYRVGFSDGEQIVCDGEHLWTVEDEQGQRVTLTTLQLNDRHTVPAVAAFSRSAAIPPRAIVTIESVPSVPVRCIQVDSPSQLYLAGKKLVPTHNTTLCEVACLWSLLFGHREFIALIGSDEDHAAGMLESIKSELENNDLLEADFSEVCGPIRALEGIHQRAGGQLYQGERTHVGWTSKEIVLPSLVAGEMQSSGAIVQVAGITGRIRGMKHKRPDGRSLRPSLVLLDDPQTDESARSPSQCQTREQILAGAILGLAGPGRKIAGLMKLTVVRPDDMADRLLDRDKHPQWQGERTKMVYAFPTATTLWDQYGQLRGDGQRTGRGTADATAFYADHRQQMDAGAVVAWPERHNPDELSALQHAMNLQLDHGEHAFFAEYQNEPREIDVVDDELMSVSSISNKTNGLSRGIVPLSAQHLTMFIDIQGALLYWAVCAFTPDFTGSVIDYGSYPDQRLPYFSLRDARNTLMGVHRGSGQEGAIFAGLNTLANSVLGRVYKREDGAELRVNRALVDANWATSTEVVYQFCRTSPHAALLHPSHGRYVGASSLPMSDYADHAGDRSGLHWRMPAPSRGRSIRHVLIDTNFWKSFVQARLATKLADKSSLSLFETEATKVIDHLLLAEHLTSEYRIRTHGRGRVVDEWKIRPSRPDNHWLDCVVGCHVAAAMQGCALADQPVRSVVRPARKVITFAEAKLTRRVHGAGRRTLQ